MGLRLNPTLLYLSNVLPVYIMPLIMCLHKVWMYLQTFYKCILPKIDVSPYQNMHWKPLSVCTLLREFEDRVPS